MFIIATCNVQRTKCYQSCVTNDLYRLINDYKLSHLFSINVDPVLAISRSVAVDCVPNFWRNMMTPNPGGLEKCL
jgi:hypothetical protein